MRELTDELAPAYKAVELLENDNPDYQHIAMIDITIIEHHPKWKPLYEEQYRLTREFDQVMITLGMAWEDINS